MTKSGCKWIKHALALVLALAMCMSLCTTGVYAAGNEATPTYAIKKIDVPVEDGVYYATVNLWQASSNQPSMGNASLRGSSSFKTNQPDDTYSKAILVVKDNKATAIVEFMPMGFIGQYGFMMELESVDAKHLQQWGGVYDKTATYTPAASLTRHMTTTGATVYDSYNDPESSSVFNGNRTRPAGFGYGYDRPVDIANIPYSHLLALDATPISIADENGNFTDPETAAEYGADNAAFVHVFVPVMFSISASSGDQYAKLKVDWTSLEKIEDPDSNLSYRLWAAKQIQQGNASDEAYSALQAAIAEVTTKMENIWPSQHISMNGSGMKAQPKLEQKEFTAAEQASMVKILNDAIDGLAAAPDKTALTAKINEAKTLNQAEYSAEDYSKLESAIRAAETVNKNDTATQEEINAAAEKLQSVMNGLTKVDDATKWSNLYNMASSLDESDYTAESWTEFTKVWVDNKYKDYPDSSKLPMVNILKVSFYNNKLESAMAALVEKPTLDTDPNQLPDGKYTLKAYMYKTADPTVYSMSNNAINHNVWLEVKDGKYYLTAQFIGMTIYNQFGYLRDLKYFDLGYTIGEYGTPQGTLLPATVLSTQKDAAGKDIIDRYNDAANLYPEMVQFELVERATKQYTVLQVFVPIMEGITAGLGTQTVYMELDWSKLRVDDGSVKKMDPPVQSPELTATDEATGVKVHADKGVFEEGTKLVVTPVTSGDIYEQGKESFAKKKIGDTFVVYDVNFTDAQGAAVTPNGYVTYSLPIPRDYNSDGVVLMKINDLEDNIGPSTQISGFTIENGYLTIRYNARTAKPIHFALVDGKPYAAADYTAVDEALAKIPADLSRYTEESVRAVEKAKNAVVRGRNETEQASVDAMAKAINDAVAALELKNSREILQDGVYSVEFSMVKMNRTDLSMSNDAVSHTAKLVVENGEYTLYINFKGLHYLNRFGYLAKLSYYEEGYSFGTYGAINGTLKNAAVLATQKDAAGADVIDEFNTDGGVFAGNLYPLTVSFPLVSTAIADEDGYVPLHVFVPVMEDIAAGNGDQDVLMKLDWSTLQETTADDPVFRPEEPEELSPALDYTDIATGVKIHADKGVFDRDVQVVVSEIKDGADYNAAADHLKDVGKKFKLYSVKFMDKDGSEVTPNGAVRITLPIPAGYKADTSLVYRMEGSGKVLVKGAAGTDGYTVATRSAGSYTLVEKNSTITDAQNTAENEHTPKTGDSSPVWLLLAWVSAAGAAATVACAKKRKTF